MPKAASRKREYRLYKRPVPEPVRSQETPCFRRPALVCSLGVRNDQQSSKQDSRGLGLSLRLETGSQRSGATLAPKNAVLCDHDCTVSPNSTFRHREQGTPLYK